MPLARGRIACLFLPSICLFVAFLAVHMKEFACVNVHPCISPHSRTHTYSLSRSLARSRSFSLSLSLSLSLVRVCVCVCVCVCVRRCLGFFIVATCEPGLKDNRTRQEENHLSVEWRQ